MTYRVFNKRGEVVLSGATSKEVSEFMAGAGEEDVYKVKPLIKGLNEGLYRKFLKKLNNDELYKAEELIESERRSRV